MKIRNCHGALRSLRKIAALTVVMCGFIAFTQTARASLVSANDPVFGINAITKDTATGIEWLDLTLSVGRSYNDVIGAFGAGGFFEGFRYATGAELNRFFENAGIVPSISPANYFPVNQFLALVGVTCFGCFHPVLSTGLYGEVVVNASLGTLVPVAQVIFFPSANPPSGIAQVFPGGSHYLTDASPDFGNWLVRDDQNVNATPLPGAFALFASGVSLASTFGWLRRRRRAACIG